MLCYAIIYYTILGVDHLGQEKSETLSKSGRRKPDLLNKSEHA